MTSETLQTALEQNHENLRVLLAALGADYEPSEDPEKKARMGAAFHPDGASAAKDVDMTDEERAAWLFEENAKMLAAAAEAAGASTVTSPDVSESGGLDAVGKALGGRE